MANEPHSEGAEQARPAMKVLVVDNDQQHAEAMRESLERVGYVCAVATSGPEGARRVEQEIFDVVITDLIMNEVDGMQILAKAKESLADCEVVMVTGHASVPKAVEAMQLGAYNFLEKPITPNRLRAVVEKAADAVWLRRRNTELSERLDERFGYEGIIYSSDRMKQVIERLKRIAPTDAGVLITGESGTGKELVAQALHQNSPRKKKPFVALNCGAVAEHLVESELFGHIKGSFTDAVTDRLGKFEYANGGTLFLDEVGDMPLSTQIKLLRVLEERQITRVGDNKPIKVNVRVLSATNRDLTEAIKQGSFRNDLYFRLKIVTVDLPRLADRKEDIVPLVYHFRKQFAKHHQKSIRGVAPAVTRKFYEYDWPGNIRQLRNAVETMVVLDVDGLLDLDDLPPELADESVWVSSGPSEQRLPLDDDVSSDEPAAAPISIPADAGPTSLIGRPLDDVEQWAIEQTLKLTGGNREETARILGIGARTLYRKLEKYGL